MELREFYAKTGGDLDGVLKRLPGEKFVMKFILRFLDDKSFDELVSAMEAKDAETAFRASHTIKGVCRNLNFDRLGDSSAELSDALRGGSMEGTEALFEKVKVDYKELIEAIRELQG
ncbi:MAG: Hpt domain-containing protein [Eubacterium sp.]|nr:Hpt domain-containing protein [Eubacterium sp.]